ncbi:hypothetical protein DV589_24820 [Salmonella enterica]|nr:hypothetical protein [Salmonella enterica]
MLNVQEKVSIVNELRQEWPLSRLLIVAGLPRSIFYYHVKRLAAPDLYQSARALVLKSYHQHKGRYGYRRIRLACRNEGVLLNSKTVRKLMKELGISSLIRVKKYRSYKGEQGRICDNFLKRKLDAKRPNEKWVTDVTEFKVNGKCHERCKSGSSATWVEIFMPEDSSPVASVARTRPSHTFAVSASSDDLHGPRQHHYSSYW